MYAQFNSCCFQNFYSQNQQPAKIPGFNAVFNSELNYYNYSQGIVHVSSFGFGGTNAHAIFWGEVVGSEMRGIAWDEAKWLGSFRKIPTVQLPYKWLNYAEFYGLW